MKPITPIERSGLRQVWPAYAILAVMLLLTLLLARNVARVDQAKEQARFENSAERTREQFQRTINGNMILLDGLRGLVAAKLGVGPQQFQAYVEALQLRQHYPGVQGLGFSWRVPQAGKEKSLNKARETNPSFHIWPDSDLPEFYPILYFAPPDVRNLAQLGRDLSAEPPMRIAMVRAAETAQPTVSPPYEFSTESGQKRTGFLLLAPAYHSGEAPETRDERAQKLYGFVFCAFYLEDLLKVLADAPGAPEIAFTIYEGSNADAGQLLYESSPAGDRAKSPQSTLARKLTVADGTWTVVFSKRAEFAKESGRALNPFIVLFGSAISLSLFGMLLARAKTRIATKQRLAAERLSEARFRHLVEQSIVGIYVIQNGRFAYVNPKMLEIYGCSTVEELTSPPVTDFVAEESRALARENIEKRLRGEVDSIHYELRGLRLDGTAFDLEVHGGRVEYDGQPAILGSLIDITERKRAAEKAAWLASFPERNPQPIVELDPATGVVHYANPAAALLFPDIQELGLQHPFLTSLDEEQKALICGHAEVLQREIKVGESTYAQTVNFLPEIKRLRFYGSDITARKRVESEVARQRAELQIVLDTVPALIFFKDAEHRIIRVNEESVRVVGLPKEALEGQTDKDLGRAHAEQYYQDENEVMASGEAKRGIVEPIETSRGTRWLQTDKLPYRDETGRVVGVIGFALDITERKHAEERLRRQLERLNLLQQITRAIGERQDLRSIFQVVVRSLEEHLKIDFCGVCLFDPIDEVLIVSCVGVRGAELAVELALTEDARIPIDRNGLSRCVRGQLVYEPDISQVQFPFPQRLAQGGLRSLVAAPLLVESKVFGVLLAARRQPESFSSGECEFLRQLSEHVALATHQAQLYAALQQAYDELRQTQQAVMQQERLGALGQMASGIAHDINNAISPVALYTESLLENEPNLSARARNYLETIQHAIGDVAGTVSRMRDFYRPRESQLALVNTSLNSLLRQVVDLTRVRWSDMPQQRGCVIQLQTEFEPELPAILGVESEIRDALTNLIFNAVDAMPSGGTLTLRTKSVASAPAEDGDSAPPRVRVEVADTGVGMDEETRARCLEPFYTTKGERGTGLGLAMVFGTAQRHDAEIEIQSELGRGTAVCMIFPQAPPAGAPVVSMAPARPRQRLRLLMVDDDPLLIKSLRDALEGDGHLVTAADGGQAGIDAFLASRQDGEPFAAVITDLGMPYVDGRKVAAAIKEASAMTPVILLTGWGQRMIEEGDIPPHVDRVLSKPPKLRELREALAHFCPDGDS